MLRAQLLRPLLPASATVLDLDAEQGAFATLAAASPLSVVVAALCDAPDDLVYDAVVLWSGFEWTDTPLPDLVRIRHRVRPGGVFVVGLDALAPDPTAASSAMPTQVFSQESIVLALQRAGFDTMPPRDVSVPSSRLPESVASVLDRVRSVATGSPLLRGSVEWLDQVSHNTRPADLVVVASRR